MQQKILVLEDDLTLSAGLCFELDSAGYLTVAAYNCQKARQLLKGDHFDLALLDVNLPDGNGFDLCREIKAQKPELPVIFLTANDLERDVLSGFDMGAEDYVTKPFNMQILLRRVEVVLRRAGVKQPAPRWTSPRSPPSGARKNWSLPPMNISCSRPSRSTAARFLPGRYCWSACGTAAATSSTTTR